MTAEDALAAWGGGTLRLIKDRENVVYEAQLSDGRRAALRLHREGYQSTAAIRSELWWMQAVAHAGVPVPEPVPTQDGKLLQIMPGGRVATMISWVEGEELGEADKALGGSEVEQISRFRAVGALVARLHNATDALTLPEWFSRPAWDCNGFLGAEPFWGRFWENPTLSATEVDTVQAARAAAREILQGIAGQADYGLIHADVLRENVFFTGTNPVLIDFDDSGFGYRIYDLATLASQNHTQTNDAELMDAALSGYRQHRALSDEAARLLPMFLMLRRFASCGWVVPRVPMGDARMRIYAERAAVAARRFLESTLV